jgi:surface protein
MIATAFVKKGQDTPTVETWTRPTDWLPLPTVPAQGLVGLSAVYENYPSLVAVKARTSVASTSGGAYLVDWGDGSAPQEYPENTVASKSLDWSSYPAASTTSRGYRQAIIKVTPKTGQNLTQILLQSHPDRGNSVSPWLDVELNGTTALTTIGIGSTRSALLERAKIHSFGNVTSLANLFNGCRSLREVLLPTSATKITSFASMYKDCQSLTTVPYLEAPNINTIAAMFYGCNSLISAPTLNTAKVTTMAQAFQLCTKLEAVQPLFASGVCTNTSSMFNSCCLLKNAPSFSDTSKVTTMASMFANCFVLESAPPMNCTAVTNSSAMFYYCYALRTIPAYTFSKVTNISSFAYNAFLLEDLSHITINPLCTNFSNFCYNAVSLKTLPALDLSASTNNAGAFYAASSLRSIVATGIKAAIDVRYCSLSAAALNAIFTNLVSRVGQTALIIYVRGNLGLTQTGYDPTIATAKNWTVNTTT